MSNADLPCPASPIARWVSRDDASHPTPPPLQVLYRQFVVLLGMIVFPFLTFIAAGAFVLEYWLDKTRLVYICQKPTFKEEPLRGGLIFFCFVLISLVTIVSYPNGMAFIFAGLNLDQCQFFQ